MKYYLIAGEASGDLHASRLMESLSERDADAQFRFFGGDMMASVGGTRVKHYRELAYMGLMPVLLHINTIMSNMKLCRKDILSWRPDVVILVDYPGFNLRIASFVKKHTSIPVYYYISPKIWAWKEYRIKTIKITIDELFSILPFEVPFFEGKHHYPIHYVGNPTVEEVNRFNEGYHETVDEFHKRNALPSKPIIALLAGSRKQEINNNLKLMISAASRFTDYQLVIAGAPGIDPEYYRQYVDNNDVSIVFGETYALLKNSVAALVTSGTATLETALLGVPQVVCYYMSLGKLMSFGRKLILHIKYVSLVNLIADKEVVKELVADKMTINNTYTELQKILPGSHERNIMLDGYKYMGYQLGMDVAPDNTAEIIVGLLKQRDRI
ncbi:MAG: lipid-A-disaccharide synthase [Bacteroidaceae bacterium]|nr:lipid-A-disaccharide synthase [Bacteroidaceae bacterium]